jgi:hypothetical protein
MGQLDFREIAELINPSRTTQIDLEPIKTLLMKKGPVYAS